MSNEERISLEEKALLQTREGAFVALMGYLKAERGKIAPSVFNKFAAELMYDKASKGDLMQLAGMLEEDEELKNVYTKAFERIIRLEDIPQKDSYEDEEEEHPLSEPEAFARLTNFLIDSEDNNARLRELRKLQREGIYMKILMDNLQKELIQEFQGMPRAKYLKTEPVAPQVGDRSLILLFSDWHLGALVFNEDTGGYNFKKLTGSVQKAMNQALAMVEELNIKNVYVFHLGDMIEHISMRKVNQAFESEFPATKQIAKANRLLVDMLSVLSKQVHVTFGLIAGNHDRFDGNKNDKIYNDNIAYILLDNLFMLQEDLGQLPNVTLIDNREDTYSFTITVAGRKIKVTHGDHEQKKSDVKIPRHIKKEPIDMMIMGHVHTTRIIQEDYDRFHVYVGSTLGANNFSKELNLPTTSPAQMVIVLTEGSRTPMFIPLFDI